MGQTTHDNHYVPQFYLKYWSNNRNTILTHDLLVAHKNVKAWREAPIKGIACQRDLYTQHNGGSADDAIEDEFSNKYESPVKEVFKKVIADAAISDGEMGILVDYLVLQAVRTPAWFERVSEILKKVAGPTFESVVKEAEGLSRDELLKKKPTCMPQAPFPPVPFKVSIDREERCAELRMAVGRQSYQYSIGHFLKGPVNEALHGYAWRVASLRCTSMLPTSDNPVVSFCMRQDGQLGIKHASWHTRHDHFHATDLASSPVY